MKKLTALFSIFILASCQPEEVTDIHYLECVNTKNISGQKTYFKIDLNKKSIEPLSGGGFQVIYDDNFYDNGLVYGASNLQLGIKLIFHKFNGNGTWIDEKDGALADTNFKCKSIKPFTI